VRAAHDVASDEIGVAALEIGRSECAAGEDAVAKARREAFHLLLDFLAHIGLRSVGHMAIGPSRVAAFGRACRIKEARLHEDHKRAFWNLVLPAGSLGSGDFVH